jgi:type I restriction enzyme, S subunit
LSLTILNNIILPLPPLAEQHRIVSKVEQLMNLCDQLEAQISDTQSQGKLLMEAVMQQAMGKS